MKEVYGICNGNPSHVTDYLECGEYGRLAKDVDDEYEESQTSLMQGYLGLESSDPINDSIIDLMLNGTCERSDIPVKVGLAYCMKSNGIGIFKCSSMFYLESALVRRGRFKFRAGLPWHRLESLTIMLIVATDVTVKSTNYTINIPKANKVKHQKEIGNFSSHNINDGIATLFVLAPNHNIIDSILYDRRQSPATVYFIQTSSMNYSAKKKKLVMCI